MKEASFTAVAKEAGRRWRELPSEERERAWKRPAAEKLQEYKVEFGLYKQTDNYKKHEEYLKKFEEQRRQQVDKDLSKAAVAPRSEPQGCRASLAIQCGYSEAQWEDAAEPVKAGMDEVLHITEKLNINSDLVRVAEVPEEDVTAKAVEFFLHGTGSLLYLWDKREARAMVTSVYHSQSKTTPAYATEVFAMAAVGSYCDGESHEAALQEEFLHRFVSLLSATSAISNLHFMRIFTCLAVCLFMDTIDSARSLIASALDIGRQTLSSPSFERENSEDARKSWWNIFRSVLFLESWFSYNTGHESRVSETDLSLYHPSFSTSGSVSEALQESVSELGQIAAYIALDLRTNSQPKAVKAGAHFKTLEQWHRSLSPLMQLSQLSFVDPFSLNAQTKRSLLQLHILFLGLFIEPHRDCLLDLARYRLGNTEIAAEELHALEVVEEQSALAARQSARVAALLQADSLIPSRCWVSMYTCYTSCAILLCSASQKLLKLLGEEVGQELLYASSHLNALSFCSYNNQVAKQLHLQLQVIFNDIRDILASPAYRNIRDLHRAASNDAAQASIMQYGGLEGTDEVTNHVLDVIKRMMDILQESLRF